MMNYCCATHDLVQFDGARCPVCKLVEKVATLEHDLDATNATLEEYRRRLEDQEGANASF